MCLIVYAKTKTDLDWAILERGHEGNPHGFGIMYPDGKNVLIYRDYTINAKESWELFKDVIGNTPEEKPVAIHFRWRTHGSYAEINCHPFQLLEKDADGHDLYMMHNGVISDMEPVDKEDHRSDTAIFAEDFVKPILKGNPDFILRKQFHKIMKEMIGTHNRLLFMRSDGRVWFANEHQGTWKDKVWYSNTFSFHQVHSRGSGSTRTNGTTTGSRNAYDDYWNETLNKWTPKASKRFLKSPGSDSNTLAEILKPFGFTYVTDGFFVYSAKNDIIDKLMKKRQEQQQQANKNENGSQPLTLVQAVKNVVNMFDHDKNVFIKKVDPTTIEEKKEPSRPTIVETPSIEFFRTVAESSLKQMSEAEIFLWLIDYPILARDYMINHGFSGGAYEVDEFIDAFGEHASEWIYHRVNNNIDKLNQLNFSQELGQLRIARALARSCG